MSRRIMLISLAILVSGWMLATDVRSEGPKTEWETLNEKATTLFQNGETAKAKVVASEALKLAQRNLGPNDPDVATILENNAFLHDQLGEESVGKILREQASEIRSRAFSRESEELATTMSREVTCKTVAMLPAESNRYCNLSFRGLEVEFQGVNLPPSDTSRRPNLMLKAIGNQQVLLLKSDCIRVYFNDLRSKGSNLELYVTIRGDGRVFGRDQNPECVG